MYRLSRYSNYAYLLLRLISGSLFAFHGIQKLFGILTDVQPPVGSQLWFGGIIELVCGFLITIGFLTRYAAIVASGTMAIAYLQFHWQFQWGSGFFPVVNQGELALIYCFIFLYIATRGGVILCVDKTDDDRDGGLKTMVIE